MGPNGGSKAMDSEILLEIPIGGIFFLLRPFPYLYYCIQICALSFSLVTVLDQQLSKPLRRPANHRIADNQTGTTNQSSSDRPSMADPDTLIKVE
jgi:hypothetical protein